MTVYKNVCIIFFNSPNSPEFLFLFLFLFIANFLWF